MDGIEYDFEADNRFFEENHGMLCLFHIGKTLLIHKSRVVFAAISKSEAYNKALALGVLGQCSILEVTGNVDKDLGIKKMNVYQKYIALTNHAK